MLFLDYGKIVISEELSKKLVNSDYDLSLSHDIEAAWHNYLTCNMGDVCESDKQNNHLSGKILGKYHTCEGDIYIFTDESRAITTFMFCSESTKNAACPE